MQDPITIDQSKTESASILNIKSFNARSIGQNTKRKQVFNSLKKKELDIIFVVDTRFAKSIENRVKAEWGGQSFFSSFTSQARGVAIFFRKNIPVEVLDKRNDNDGNILSLLIKFSDKRILLTAIYGPNTDCPSFYTDKIFSLANEWQPEHAIYGGDWNLVLDQAKDTHNYIHNNNINARKAVLKGMEDNHLVDPWRNMHAGDKRYTWTSSTRPKKYARLDFFLISDTLFPYVAKTSISPGVQSDHSIISLSIDFNRFHRGRGFWKMNNVLLKDTEYVAKVKSVIRETVKQYSEANFTDEEFEQLDACQLQGIPLNINPQLFFDTLLLEIRGMTLKYSGAKKRERQTNEKLLLHELERLESALHADPDNVDIQASIHETNQQVDAINKIEAEGAAIRCRAQFQVDGEKPTRFFCNMEKSNAVQKFIPSLFVGVVDDHGRPVLDNNGKQKEREVTEQAEVEAETRRFYRKLYSCQDNVITIDTIEDFLGPYSNSCPKLTIADRESMEGELTLSEISNYLKRTRNNKSPGSSGFTGEFFKFFFRDIRQFMLSSVNYSFAIGSLSVTQKLGILTLLPKGSKDKRYIKNWRPITLLNTYYKIVSGCVTERIKPKLDKLIHADQKGFVGGRFIGESIRTTFDCMQAAKENNKGGLLLLIDFEKAFDSISFSFLKKCLHFYNFGPDIIKWISILLKDFYAVINHCGNISEKFPVLRGCRQGDPSSPYLFILAVEFLAHKIRSETGIEGFPSTKEIKETTMEIKEIRQ